MAKNIDSVTELVHAEKLKYQVTLKPQTTQYYSKEGIYAVKNQDTVSKQLLTDCGSDMFPVKTYGDGNCFPRAVVFFCTNMDYTEARVRLVYEMVQFKSIYLSDKHLQDDSSEVSAKQNIAVLFSSYSNQLLAGQKLTTEDASKVYDDEVMQVRINGAYCGIWQLYAMSSVLGVRIRSVYPGRGPPHRELNRLVKPRRFTRKGKTSEPLHIMWTSTFNADIATWWGPNHFVPLIAHPVEQGQLDNDQLMDNSQSSEQVEVCIVTEHILNSIL
jgi:hypothetical protein